MEVINTKRLSIREVTRDDLSGLTPILSDKRVMQYSTIGAHSLLQMKEFIERSIKNYQINGFGHWIICHLKTNDIIGICGLNRHIVDDEPLIHINYRIAVKYQRKGYAFEAVKGVTAFAFNNLALERIFAIIEPKNVASMQVIHKAEFERCKQTKFKGLKVDIFTKNNENC